ncbi:MULTISPECIES: HU family DNA-binding protein [Haloferax]|uniref:Twin-arginine translocation signal domain-containing protein n=2 Tax=Haloferax TaxID=2251 RepID=A0A6G1Z131_9EURY|nr:MULTISPECIES: HU family DNA-binding protein [Haloferax]KAB1187496.1 HU family DNA-binding protein [Haloferax sp. CBA1149]MRW80148.1 twin-arginine translocation signal domain-containing protein [Haloferax marinisediminis]
MSIGNTQKRTLSRRDVLRKSSATALLLGLGLTGMSGPAVATSKPELVEAIATESGLSKADAKRAVDSLLSTTTKALIAGKSVTVVSFGMFSISKRSARTGRNDSTTRSSFSFEPCPKFATALDLTPGVGDEHRNPSSYRCHDGDVVVDAEQLAREHERRDADSGLSKADAKRALDAFVTATANALVTGDTVSLGEFGSFSISKRSARTGRNPQTGKEIKIPAKNEVKFKAGAELSKSVN